MGSFQSGETTQLAGFMRGFQIRLTRIPSRLNIRRSMSAMGRSLDEISASNLVAGGTKPVSNMELNVLQQKKQRRTNSLLVLLMLKVSAISSLVYQAYHFQGVKRYDEGKSLKVNLALAMSVIFLQLSFWGLTVLWYFSLPSIKNYGKVFNLNWFIVRYPHLPGFVSLANIFAAVGAYLTFIVIMPELEPDMLEMWNEATLWSMAILTLSWVLTTFVISSLLSKCFTQLLSVAKVSLDGRSLQGAKRIIVFTRFMVVIIGVAVVALITLVLFLPGFTSSFYVIFNVLFAMAHLGGMYVSYLFFNRSMRDKEVRRQRANGSLASSNRGSLVYDNSNNIIIGSGRKTLPEAKDTKPDKAVVPNADDQMEQAHTYNAEDDFA